MRSLMLKMKTLFKHKKKDSPEEMYESSDMTVEDMDKAAALNQCKVVGD